MTTQKVADRFIELARQSIIEDILKELFSSAAISIEPDESMGPRVVEGLPAILKKARCLTQPSKFFMAPKFPILW